MRFQALNNKIHQLTTEQDPRKALDAAIEAANEFIKVLKPSVTNLPSGEDALDEAIPTNQFPNQKVESWFAQHPYFTGERVALKFYATDLVETKFYWLGDNASKARVSAGVMLTPNWEDSDLTRNDVYKVGIDFFLTADSRSLLVVISNRGKLRILEFNDKLSHTQIEVLDKLHNVLELDASEKIHEILWSALALSEVNKKFYAGIAEQFNILLNHLIADTKDKEDAKLFASRLIGRLLFLWFLRKKDIIDESFGYFDLTDADSTTYYEHTLSKLFFQTLNTPVHDRQTKDVKTPYLNGGLFEAQDNDWVHSNVDFPIGFFNGLYEHLEKYNFTTDESSPEYEQVAIDPEMLGRVFESLLATQLTETGEQARKAKGAFYTPREIVSYMCKESLRHYLYSKFGGEDQKIGIDDLLDKSDARWETEHSNAKSDLLSGDRGRDFSRDILAALDDLKILDPACGSGAFPMGMLQLMLKTYGRLESRFDPYQTKLKVIEGNIFGVDIEPMAMEISRLRAWLSLIVDEENTDGVKPLPNLDFKFVCANSLIPLDQQTGIFADAFLHEKLAEVRIKFFNARKPEMKSKWKDEYYELTGRGQASMLSNRREEQLKSFDPFKNKSHAEFFDADYMFGVREFDIVIGNPPYINVFLLAKDKDFDKQLYKDKYVSARGSFDIYVLFFELGLSVLGAHGVMAYITPNKYLSAEYARALRSILFSDSVHPVSVADVSKVSVFDAAVYPIVSVYQKGHPVDSVETLIGTRINGDTITISNVQAIQSKDFSWASLINGHSSWIDRLDALPKLPEFADVSASFAVTDSYKIKDYVKECTDDIAPGYRKFIISSNIKNYAVAWGEKRISYLKLRFDRPVIPDVDSLPITEDRKMRLSGEKLVIAGMTKHLRVFHDVAGDYVPSIPTVIITNFRASSRYLSAVLNSKLIDYYYRHKYDSLSLAGGYLRVGVPQLSTLPIAIPDPKLVTQIEVLVAKVESGDRTKIAEIDSLVYQAYGLSTEEIGIIEDTADNG